MTVWKAAGIIKDRHPKCRYRTCPNILSTSSPTSTSLSDRHKILGAFHNFKENTPLIQKCLLRRQFHPIFTHSHLVLDLFLCLITTHNCCCCFFLFFFTRAINVQSFHLQNSCLGSSSQHFLHSTRNSCVAHSPCYKCSFCTFAFFKLWCKHWAHGQQGSGF